MPSDAADRPRPILLEVDLDAWGGQDTPAEGAVVRRPWAHPDPLCDRVGAVGGTALGLARFHADQQRDLFVVCVGPAVVRGVPTAARATVMAASPLTGRLTEGQVGSDLGRRLASVASALVLRGALGLADAALVIDEVGGARIEQVPGLEVMTPEARRVALEARLGPCAVLRPGPAAARAVPFANLAAGGDPPSFTGRAGLGAALAARGVQAIAITAPPVADAPVPALVEALCSSPRLESRMEGGTLELTGAAAARGDLEGVDAPALEARARERASARHGCKGCPTPCGWAFEAPGSGRGSRGGARFSAMRALGVDLGLPDPDDAFALLARCNELGLDAREAAARLTARGDRGALLDELDHLAEGASAAARTCEEVLRPTRDLAAALGQAVGARGAEPLRSFPFLVGDGVGRARIGELLDPIPLPARSEAPTDPAGKGRLVWWHENLAAALDAAGFCAFSAAGLLDDGAADLDGLARWVLPEAHAAIPDATSAGEALLALGATLEGWIRELHRAWSSPARASAAPEGYAEYRAFRGLGDDGDLGAAARGALGSRAALDHWRAAGVAEAGTDAPRARPQAARRPGRASLVAGGALGRHLGGELVVEGAFPMSLEVLLRAAADVRPEAARWLVQGANRRPLPAAWRDGALLDAADEVQDGDRLELLLVVSGG